MNKFSFLYIVRLLTQYMILSYCLYDYCLVYVIRQQIYLHGGPKSPYENSDFNMCTGTDFIEFLCGKDENLLINSNPCLIFGEISLDEFFYGYRDD